MWENKAERLCHNIDLNVHIEIVRIKERGDVSTLRPLEPRALIPAAHKNRRKRLKLNFLMLTFM